ncbi:hypothetical protein GCM10027614_20110 [Micromonospora vulcania]
MHTRSRVRWIHPESTGFRIGLNDGELTADAVVLAVPHQVAASLVPPAAAPTAGDWHRLGAVPIVNVHLRYERRVTALTMAAAVESPAQWIFDRSDPGADDQHLVVSLSAADADIDRPAAELVATQRAALAELFPAARRTPVRDAFVTREPRATFRQTPVRGRTGRCRPPACPGWSWPAHGPTPVGRTRWRARCAAAGRPPTWSPANSCPGPDTTRRPHDDCCRQ